VEGEHERVGQGGLVVLAVAFGGDDVVAVVGLGVGEGGPDDLSPMLSRSAHRLIASGPQNSRWMSLTKPSLAKGATMPTLSRAFMAVR
jgi:hypothetical protein